MKRSKIRKKQVLKVGKLFWSICRFLLLFGLGFIILYPLIQTLSRAFMPISQYNDVSVIWIPKSLTLDNIKSAMEYLDFWPSLGNTVILCLTCAALQIIICGITGYGFARFRFPFREPLFMLVILSIIVPSQIIFLPTFIQYRFFDFFGISRLLGAVTGENYTKFCINLIASRWSFWLPSIMGTGIRSGIFIYLFRQCFRNIPKELEEAAKIDGCGTVGTFLRVMCPNARSSALTVFLFSVVWHWNEYTLTRTFFPQKHQPLAVKMKLAVESLQATRQAYDLQMGVNYASILLFLIPVLILYIIAQKWFVEGVETSGIKG